MGYSRCDSADLCLGAGPAQVLGLIRKGFPMRWLAAATILAVLASGLIGCGTSDDPIEPGGEAGSFAEGGSAGSAARGGAGHAGAGHAGSAEAGESSGGSADEGAAGSALSGAGGALSGAGGALGGSGGAAPSVPAPPSVFFVQILSTTSISIRWKDNATDETGYYVSWSSTGIKPATPNATITGDATVGTKSTTVEGLSSGISYYFWIEAYNASGSSSALTGTATAGLVPPPLTGLQLDYANQSTRLSFTWTDSVGETGYHVYLATSPLQPPTPVHDLPANSVSYTFPSGEITPYTFYYVWISAYNAVGDGLPTMRFGIVGTPPAAPKSVSIHINVPSFSITASWAEGSSNTTQYNVYWSQDDTKSGYPDATVDGKTQTSTLNKVIGNRFYRLWVEAANPVGTSYAVQTIATTKTSDLSWRELWFDLDTQNVHLAVDDDFHIVGDADPQTELNLYQSNTSWVYDMGVPTAVGPSGSFLWNAATFNMDTGKPHYFWLEAKTPAGTLLSQRALVPGSDITHLVATPSQNSVNLSWDPTPFPQTYRVYTGSVNFPDQWVLTNTTTTASATVTGLQPGTHYEFFVRSISQAIGGGGFLSEWDMTEATTTGP